MAGYTYTFIVTSISPLQGNLWLWEGYRCGSEGVWVCERACGRGYGLVGVGNMVI